MTAISPPEQYNAPPVEPMGHYVPTTGDGTTARSRFSARWKKIRWALAIILVLILGAWLASIITPPESKEVAAPDNPGPQGAQAVAQVLGRHGVTTEYVTTHHEAVNAATEDTTLVVIDNDNLNDAQLQRLADTRADLVLVDPYSATLEVLTQGSVYYEDYYGSWYETLTLTAQCPDLDATTAGTLKISGSGLSFDPSQFEGCFPLPEEDGWAYVTGEVQGRSIAIVTDPSFLLNENIAEEGNAALALRILGRHQDLTWYIPSFDEFLDEEPDEETPQASVLPPGTSVVLWHLAAVLLVMVIWRSRRLGPLVPEDLPVIVRSVETTEGRGRLYRRGRARGHAAAGLRAASADVLATSLGLPRSTQAAPLISAIAQATGRAEHDIAALLYGPPPPTDAALLDLAHQLDFLEREVHRS